MEKNLSEIGEEIAATYLMNNNYKIISRNLHSQYGEIDIIALKNKTLVFVEVKARSSSFNNAFNSVSISKQKKISKTASIFLSKFPKYEDLLIRFDVIAILRSTKTDEYRLKHLKNAFEPNLF